MKNTSKDFSASHGQICGFVKPYI